MPTAKYYILIHMAILRFTGQKKIDIGNTLKIKANKKWIKFPIVKTFSDVGPYAPLAYIGSNETLELAVNLGNASEYFGFKTGEILNIK